MTSAIRLGVNIDHVATLRNARGGTLPSPLRAARAAMAAGADSITAHLREDRRHMVDADIEALVGETDMPLNLEMAATEEMCAIACRCHPHAVCLVPERREERTTEGGLDAVAGYDGLVDVVARLSEAGCRVSLFVEAKSEQLEAARALKAHAVELHTGAYCDAEGDRQSLELERIRAAARRAEELGLQCHAGHGLTYDTVSAVAAVPQIVELNIGHFLVGEAVFVGLRASIRRMRELMTDARAAPHAMSP